MKDIIKLKLQNMCIKLVLYLVIQNTVTEKFCNKTFFTTSVFLNIISIFTLATLSSPTFHLKRMFPHTKTSTLVCLKELVLNELSSEKYFSKLEKNEIKQHCHFNFYLNVQQEINFHQSHWTNKITNNSVCLQHISGETIS